MIGKIVSHYKILEELGEGGMGVVYRAEDTRLDRLVALKFLRHHLTASESEKARFLQEAKAASAINHPNVCVIHDIQEHDGQQFIIMEYVDGVTLRQKLQDSPLETRETVDYAIQVAEALCAAHAKGIIHRDVKSDNIMITRTNRVKVMDFGLAKLRGSLRLTKSATTVGTLAYMSPEHIRGEKVDTRSDIFSFGVVLYEMLSGRLPFQGEYESALMYSILNEEPEPIEKHRPDLSSEFLHILDRALEKDSNDRYQSVNDMLIDLRRLKRDSDKVSRKSLREIPVAPDGRTIGKMKAGEHDESGEIAGRRAARERVVWMIAGLLGLVVIMFALVRFRGIKETALEFGQMQITRLTTTGKAKSGAISPDGKYVVHVMEEAGQESLWLKQIATNSNVRILAPAEVDFLGLTFSHDGNYIYYVMRGSSSTTGTLYRMPVLGGSSRKVLGNVSSPITLSPDGKRLAFIRGNWREGVTTLIVAGMDGGHEETLAVRRVPDSFLGGGPAWSPDGRVIVSGAAQREKGKIPFSVVGVEVESGRVRAATTKGWGNVEQIAWLGDGSGFLFPAADQSSSWFTQIWYVSYPEGRARRMTHDLNHYLGVSLTEDSRTLLTVQSAMLSNVWVARSDEIGQAGQVTSGKYDGYFGVAWTPGGKIVYGSRDLNIWLMDADGSNPRLLTVNEHNNMHPSVSSDGRYIVFASFRSHEAINIWRMDIDGGNVKQLTAGLDDRYPRCSPDGKWVAYRSLESGGTTVWKVPIDGGDAVKLTDTVSYHPDISPDGKLIACFYQGDPTAGSKTAIAVLPFSGGEPITMFDVPPDIADRTLRWTPDQSAVTYVVDRGGVSNIWKQPLDGSPPTQLTDFKTDRIFFFDWSKDGKRLVCSRGAEDNDVVMIRNFR